MESLESQNAYSSMAAQGGGLVGEVEMLAGRGDGENRGLLWICNVGKIFRVSKSVICKDMQSSQQLDVVINSALNGTQGFLSDRARITIICHS